MFPWWYWLFLDTWSVTGIALGELIGALITFHLVRRGTVSIRRIILGIVVSVVIGFLLSASLLHVLTFILFPFAMAFAYPEYAFFWVSIGIIAIIGVPTILLSLPKIPAVIKKLSMAMARGHSVPENVIFTVELHKQSRHTQRWP